MTQQCSETFTQGNAVFHVRTIYYLLPKSQLEIVLRSLKKHLVCQHQQDWRCPDSSSKYHCFVAVTRLESVHKHDSRRPDVLNEI